MLRCHGSDITCFLPQMSHLRAFLAANVAFTRFFFCRECRDYAFFGVEFYAEFLAGILGNTQNFGRKSADNIGWWSLCPGPSAVLILFP